MPIEFLLKSTGNFGGALYRISMKYDGSGRRISKMLLAKSASATNWDSVKVTHYTGIGTEVRENFAGESPETKVVVNMPQGLGRYGIESAGNPGTGAKSFEWYLKNHLGSTMLVYGTGGGSSGGLQAAYDYRSFGEQITMTSPSTGKVTENFTGKERDDETQLNYFGARYLDPMLGVWTSVDPMRQFASPYLYAGNGVNPVGTVDPDGEALLRLAVYYNATPIKSTQSNKSYNANESVRRLQTYVSNRVNSDVDQVEVKAFAPGEHMEMQAWLNEGDVRAIMTHGGLGRMYITDVPYTDGLTYEEQSQHRFDYSDMNRLLKPTFIGQCYGNENIDTERYPNLIPPSSLGEVEVEKATAKYLIDNSTKEE